MQVDNETSPLHCMSLVFQRVLSPSMFRPLRDGSGGLPVGRLGPSKHPLPLIYRLPRRVDRRPARASPHKLSTGTGFPTGLRVTHLGRLKWIPAPCQRVPVDSNNVPARLWLQPNDFSG